MRGEARDQRVPIMLSVNELRQVDEWRREQPDLPSRSEAIRRLIEAGKSALKAPRSATTTIKRSNMRPSGEK